MGTFFAVIYIWGTYFFTLGTRGFSRVRRKQKPETALEKSLAPGVLFFRIAEKKAKIVKIRTHKNIVPHGI